MDAVDFPPALQFVVQPGDASAPSRSRTYRGADPDSVRLAYVAEAPVNWCPALGTVLANEEVIDGKSEVGGHPGRAPADAAMDAADHRVTPNG